MHFFKTEAAKRGVQYRRMIRRRLDAYVEAFDTHALRAVEPRRAYGKGEKRRAAR